MPFFHTLPPYPVPYPYILINANHPSPGLQYIARHRFFVEKVIIDSGVEIFRDPAVRDYPPGHLQCLVSLYRRVKALVPHAEVYVTTPDYPDDYHPGNLWLSPEKTNIERTLDNVLRALSAYPDVNWLIAVQGHYRDPDSVVYALELYERSGVDFRRHNYIAIANLCVENRTRIIVETVRKAYGWLWSHGYTTTKIHVFGPDARAVHAIARFIHSWDSTAWTRPRGSGGLVGQDA